MTLASPLVLIADDAEGLAQTIADFLPLEFECRTIVALDGEMAVQLAVKHMPDACILDLDLPKMDGLAAAKLIRATAPHGGPLLVALTGRDPLPAQNSGAFDGVFTKPTALPLLGMAIAEGLALRR